MRYLKVLFTLNELRSTQDPAEPYFYWRGEWGTRSVLMFWSLRVVPKAYPGYLIKMFVTGITILR